MVDAELKMNVKTKTIDEDEAEKIKVALGMEYKPVGGILMWFEPSPDECKHEWLRKLEDGKTECRDCRVEMVKSDIGGAYYPKKAEPEEKENPGCLGQYRLEICGEDGGGCVDYYTRCKAIMDANRNGVLTGKHCGHKLSTSGIIDAEGKTYCPTCGISVVSSD
jgi:hypothetical protein